MSLKDIREYINLAMQGDDTIDERLALFEKQRKNLEAQMAELQHTMDVLNFKCWFYETGKKSRDHSRSPVHGSRRYPGRISENPRGTSLQTRV